MDRHRFRVWNLHRRRTVPRPCVPAQDSPRGAHKQHSRCAPFRASVRQSRNRRLNAFVPSSLTARAPRRNRRPQNPTRITRLANGAELAERNKPPALIKNLVNGRRLPRSFHPPRRFHGEAVHRFAPFTFCQVTISALPPRSIFTPTHKQVESMTCDL